MAEPIKFTQEELDQVTKLRDENSQKISEFGQVELEILLTNQRSESLSIAKGKLQTDYVKLQTKEQELVRKIWSRTSRPFERRVYSSKIECLAISSNIYKKLINKRGTLTWQKKLYHQAYLLMK